MSSKGEIFEKGAKAVTEKAPAALQEMGETFVGKTGVEGLAKTAVGDIAKDTVAKEGREAALKALFGGARKAEPVPQAPEIGGPRGRFEAGRPIAAAKPDGAADASAFDGVEPIRPKNDGAGEVVSAAKETPSPLPKDAGGANTTEVELDTVKPKSDGPTLVGVLKKMGNALVKGEGSSEVAQSLNTANTLSKAQATLAEIVEPKYQDFVMPQKPWTNLTKAAVQIQEKYVASMRDFRIDKANAKLDVFVAKVEHHNALIAAGEEGFIKGMDGKPLNEPIILDENSIISNFRKSGKDSSIPPTGGGQELNPNSVKEIYSLDDNIPINQRYNASDSDEVVPDSIWKEQDLRESKGKERFMNETSNIATDIKNNNPLHYKITRKFFDGVNFVSQKALGGTITGIAIAGGAVAAVGGAGWLGWKMKGEDVVMPIVDQFAGEKHPESGEREGLFDTSIMPGLEKLTEGVKNKLPSDGKPDFGPAKTDGKADFAPESNDGKADFAPKSSDGKADFGPGAAVMNEVRSYASAENSETVNPKAIMEASLASRNNSREI